MARRVGKSAGAVREPKKWKWSASHNPGPTLRWTRGSSAWVIGRNRVVVNRSILQIHMLRPRFHSRAPAIRRRGPGQAGTSRSQGYSRPCSRPEPIPGRRGLHRMMNPIPTACLPHSSPDMDRARCGNGSSKGLLLASGKFLVHCANLETSSRDLTSGPAQHGKKSPGNFGIS
jgi:hypothetical protein